MAGADDQMVGQRFKPLQTCKQRRRVTARQVGAPAVTYKQCVCGYQIHVVDHDTKRPWRMPGGMQADRLDAAADFKAEAIIDQPVV